MSKILKKIQSEWQSAKRRERVYIVLGVIFMIAAIVGMFLPVVPQMPFAIISAVLFSKGSPKLHRWMRQNKHFGQAIRDWEDHHVIRPKLKILSILGMMVGAGIGHWQLAHNRALIWDAILLVSIIFVATRKSGKNPRMGFYGN